MLDRKEEGHPPTKFRPPRINFEPKSQERKGEGEKGMRKQRCERVSRKYKKIGETLSRKFRERGRMIIIIILAMQNLSQSLFSFAKRKELRLYRGEDACIRIIRERNKKFLYLKHAPPSLPSLPRVVKRLLTNRAPCSSPHPHPRKFT